MSDDESTMKSTSAPGKSAGSSGSGKTYSENLQHILVDKRKEIMKHFFKNKNEISITEKGIKSNNSTRVVSCFEMILRMHTKSDVDVVGSNILRARLRLISKTKLTQILI